MTPAGRAAVIINVAITEFGNCSLITTIDGMYTMAFPRPIRTPSDATRNHTFIAKKLAKVPIKDKSAPRRIVNRLPILFTKRPPTIPPQVMSPAATDTMVAASALLLLKVTLNSG